MPSSFKKQNIETVVLGKQNVEEFVIDESDKKSEEIYKVVGFKHKTYQRENIGGGSIIVKDTPSKDDKITRDMVVSFRLTEPEKEELTLGALQLLKQIPSLHDKLVLGNDNVNLAFFIRLAIREKLERIADVEKFKKDVAK